MRRRPRSRAMHKKMCANSLVQPALDLAFALRFGDFYKTTNPSCARCAPRFVREKGAENQSLKQLPEVGLPGWCRAGFAMGTMPRRKRTPPTAGVLGGYVVGVYRRSKTQSTREHPTVRIAARRQIPGGRLPPRLRPDRAAFRETSLSPLVSDASSRQVIGLSVARFGPEQISAWTRLSRPASVGSFFVRVLKGIDSPCRRRLRSNIPSIRTQWPDSGHATKHVRCTPSRCRNGRAEAAPATPRPESGNLPSCGRIQGQERLRRRLGSAFAVLISPCCAVNASHRWPESGQPSQHSMFLTGRNPGDSILAKGQGAPLSLDPYGTRISSLRSQNVTRFGPASGMSRGSQLIANVAPAPAHGRAEYRTPGPNRATREPCPQSDLHRFCRQSVSVPTTPRYGTLSRQGRRGASGQADVTITGSMERISLSVPEKLTRADANKAEIWARASKAKSLGIRHFLTRLTTLQMQLGCICISSDGPARHGGLDLR